VKHEKNKNGSVARNTGFRESKGDYIMCLDDDEFLPEKVSAQVNCLENRDETWGACYTKYIVKKGSKTVSTLRDKKEGSLVVEQLKRNLFIAAGSNLMLRRNIYIEINGFNETFKRNQDAEFLVKILQKYKLAYVDVLGLIINVDSHKHSNSQSINFEEITELFIETFQPYINSLTEPERYEIYRMLNLQRFRSKLFANKNSIGAFEMIKKGEVSLFDTVNYSIHLINRYIKKSRMSF
jgi:glycosyltransferase involved in cell wall biosynthesis